MVIAIDGPAGAGKSSVARGVAAELGFTYLDSGAMYRCVALAGIERGADLDDGEAMGELARGLRIGFGGGRVELDGRDVSEEIREPEVTEAAARVSVHLAVRSVMVDRQKEMIAAGDYVAEGRDIGTVVSPESPLKVFLTASDEERARRRAAQTGADVAEVLAAQRRRDETRRDPRAQRPAAGGRRRRDRHDRPLRGRGRRPRRRPAPASGGIAWKHDAWRLPTVAVVGFPNVGKSTLVNRLAGGRETVTHAQPGVTRDRKRVRCEWNGVAFELLDTGGIDLADEDELARDIQRQARLGMAEADVVMLVVDARAGVRAGDAELAATLRGAEVPVLVVANKVDRLEDEHLTAELQQARPRRAAGGLGQPRPRQRRPARPRRRAARRPRPRRRRSTSPPGSR